MKSLKLNKININQLDAEQMNGIIGGTFCCGCGCVYENSGGSSTAANGSANASNGLFSPGVPSKELHWCD